MKIRNRMKKIMIKNIIVGLVIAVVFIFSLPLVFLTLGKNGGVHHYSITVIKTATGFNSGDFTFDLWLYNPSETVYEKVNSDTTEYGGGTLTFNLAKGRTSLDIKIVESGTNGATGVTWSFSPDPAAQNNIINDTSDVITLTLANNSKTIYFDNIKVAHLVAEPVWVRTMPMTCWQVWINEDNDFQFIFWYPYKDKNWVRIYDMEDNMVFEVDLPKHDPNLIVDLPDGFYMVRTYHGEELLQEFLIGKP